jgi:hypothetical protein
MSFGNSAVVHIIDMPGADDPAQRDDRATQKPAVGRPRILGTRRRNDATLRA